MKALDTENGFSIISVLMTSVILVGAAAGLIAVVIAMYRSNSRAEAENAADQSLSMVQLIVSNKDICSSALQTSAAGKVSYTVSAPSPIDNVVLPPTGATGPSVIYTTGTPLSSKLQIASINFVPNSPDSGTAITIYNKQGNPTAYTEHMGNLVIGFKSAAASGVSDFTGGALKARQFPLTVLVGSNNTIDVCYANLSVQQICQQMGGMIDPANPSSGSCIDTIFGRLVSVDQCKNSNTVPCPAAAVGQGEVIAVTGFDKSGKPICTCQLVPIFTPK